MSFAASTSPVTDVACDLFACLVFQDQLLTGDTLAELDKGLGGLLASLAEEEKFTGKKGQQLTVHTHGKIGAKRVTLVGAGESSTFEAAQIRHLVAQMAKTANSVHAKSLAIALDSHRSASALQFAAEGAILAGYRFDQYQAQDTRTPHTVENVTVVGVSDSDLATASKRAIAVCKGVTRARNLVNEPAGHMTPTRLAEEAKIVAKEHGLEIDVLDQERCRALGMGMFLAVSQGSVEPPQFVHMTYKPKQAAKKKICLVGKGVTFDSGGLSLKPSAAMETMKIDMSGAAAVIGAMGVLAELQVPYEVHGIAACTENMPSGSAYKLGDVLTGMNGKTVEINNTDAEGRLTLGDALCYANTLEPDEIFDFATLTGACMIALGPHIAGVMSNNDQLAARWLAAADRAGESMWRLPLPERLREHLKSPIADMRNTGERHGGALTAGLFLKSFVKDTPWVHVDLAGPASADKDHGAVAKGGTGFAVATIAEYLSS